MSDPIKATEADPSTVGGAARIGLDFFWPILAVVLVSAVIFVASVAHHSMDGVGVPTSARVPWPVRTVTSAGPLQIVQISSHPDRPAADAAAQKLADQGFAVHILDSDDYSPLNRGFFVVYAGPYADSTTGRDEAKHLQARLPGALLREIRRR